MTTLRVLWLSASVWLGLLCLHTPALAEPRALSLLGHSFIETPAAELDEADWRWLRERRRLLMGSSNGA